jgi:hypothetical protein
MNPLFRNTGCFFKSDLSILTTTAREISVVTVVINGAKKAENLEYKEYLKTMAKK